MSIGIRPGNWPSSDQAGDVPPRVIPLEEAVVRPRPSGAPAAAGAPGGKEAVILKRLENMQQQLDRLKLLENMQQQLDRIEQRMAMAVEKEAYSTDEVAARLSPPRAPWTVRHWCNLGQARAWKVSGRGRQGEWRIAHEELIRLQNEGPSSPGTFDNETGGRHPACRRAS